MNEERRGQREPFDAREFHETLQERLDELTLSERMIVTHVWDHKEEFVKWPKRAVLLWKGASRSSYHKYPLSISAELKNKGIKIDQRSNGPAVMAYLYADGERPRRHDDRRGWNIHHIYDGTFPIPGRCRTLHATKDGDHFTQSAGLVAIHPIAEACADEYFWFAWQLRHEAFRRFGYNPEAIFNSET